MKKFLLATTLLAASAGFAHAEVTLSGDARMGLIDPYGSGDDKGIAFTSRARVTFTLSGSTDSGLEFGGSFRADNAGGVSVQDSNGDGTIDPTDPNEVNNGGASLGRAGSVYISGSFGKLSMGDVDNAALAAVGQVSGVGLTGLGDMNELTYMSDTGFFNDPTALYEYSANGFTGLLSATNPNNYEFTGQTCTSTANTTTGAITETCVDNAEPTVYGDNESLAMGLKYGFDNYSFGVGYENAAGVGDGGQQNFVVGASGTWGGLTAKAVYSHAEGNSEGVTGDQYAISLDYAFDAFVITGFYSDEGGVQDDAGIAIGDAAYGVGASYDLGGGASVIGGYAYDTNDSGDGTDVGGAWDLGVSMSF